MKKINISFIDGSSDIVDYLVVSDGIFSDTKSVIEKKFLNQMTMERLPLDRRLELKIFLILIVITYL